MKISEKKLYGDSNAYEIGPRIRELLRIRNIRVRTAAKMLGYSRSSYYRMLKGERIPSITMIVQHSQILDVDLCYLIMGEAENSSGKEKTEDENRGKSFRLLSDYGI